MLRVSRRPLPPHLAPVVCRMCRRQRRRDSTASDLNSSKANRRESFLATAQIQPVSLPSQAEIFCLLYLSDRVASPSLPLHLAPGVPWCSAIALRLGGALNFVANNEAFQQASAHSVPRSMVDVRRPFGG
jgi:hypothetical protein